MRRERLQQSPGESRRSSTRVSTLDDLEGQQRALSLPLPAASNPLRARVGGDASAELTRLARK